MLTRDQLATLLLSARVHRADCRACRQTWPCARAQTADALQELHRLAWAVCAADGEPEQFAALQALMRWLDFRPVEPEVQP